MSLKKLDNSRARIALIDADSVLYASCLAAERKDDNGDYIQTLTLEECFRDTAKRLERLVDDTDADDAIICLSIGRSFRYDILASYKANRHDLRKPPLLNDLKDLLIERRKPFGVLAISGLEADDICGISSTALQRANLREPLIVSIDKDMRTVPGLSYSWMREDEGIVECSEYDAARAHFIQTLMGDAVDGYHGCPGIGKAKAAKLWDDYASEEADYRGLGPWDGILDTFEAKGLTANDALTQARLAYILRDTNWNSAKREIQLWQPSAKAKPQYVKLHPNVPEGASIH